MSDRAAARDGDVTAEPGGADDDGGRPAADVELVVMLAASGQAIRVTGRAARMIALVAVYRERINGMAVGCLAIDFAHRKLRPRLQESLDPRDLP